MKVFVLVAWICTVEWHDGQRQCHGHVESVADFQKCRASVTDIQADLPRTLRMVRYECFSQRRKG